MPGTGNVRCSAAYLAALPNRHEIATKAEVWDGDSLALTLAVEAQSQVVVDRNAAIRRTCAAVLTLSDPTGTPVPRSAADPLTVYGNELVPYRGITFDDGAQEFIQLGVFGMENITIRDTQADLVITLNGKDRSRNIQRAGFQDVYVIPPATNVGQAIQGLVAFCWTGKVPLDFYFTPTDAVTQRSPLVYKPGDDPWKEAMKLAAACGCQLYFDVMGALIFAPVPDPRAQPVTQRYDEGPENLTTELLRTQSRADAPNYIIRTAMGSGVAVPVAGVAFDDNPASPTYYRGSYGTVVDSQGSSLYANQPQALAAAKADLITSLGSIEQLTNNAVPRPDHTFDDVVEVTRSRSGLTEARYVLDMVTLGFGTAGVSQMIGRQVTL